MASTHVDTAVTTSTEAPQNANSSQLASGSATVYKGSKNPVLKYKHILPIHAKVKVSCLTSGSQEAPSFVGFRNLMILVLLVSNLRLMIENFQKYGVLICIRCHDYRQQDVVLGSLLFLSVPCYLFVAYAVERAAAHQAQKALGATKKADEPPPLHPSRRHASPPNPASVWSAWHTIALAHGINATCNLAICTSVVYYWIHHPAIGTLCEIHAVVVWLKVCSYALTNRDLRHAFLSGSDVSSLPDLYKAAPYPRNITFSNLSYFWWAPTLVYQPVYPRTPSIRPLFVLKRLGELVSLSIAIWVASAQYAAPLLQNSLPIISSLDVPQILERLMKLSSISLFCWLAGFFALFQSFLNLLAEVLRFGDRAFYLDWWNSPNLRSYWSSWNRPVYAFMKRHIYLPLVARGVPPTMAQVIVFLFSGVLHEMLVGVPTHNILGVAFAGMLLQLPLIALTDAITATRLLGGATAGNVIFWVSFVLVGQPLAALLYFFAWHARYGTASVPNVPTLWKQ